MVRILLIFILFAFKNIFSQSKDEILFKINDSIIYVEEFDRVFNKNTELLENDNDKDFNSYFDLFVNYKLKLAEAYEMGLHKDPKYIGELNNYSNQLQKSYLTDKKSEEKLLKEAYLRTIKEVNVSHVLIRYDDFNNDSLAIINKLKSIKDPFLNLPTSEFKENFNQDNTMIIEDLGYFSAFKMIYKFETTAYQTPVGSVSEPFRTRFGFHILKVNDKRSSLGEVSVGHIMVFKNKDDSRKRINNILDSINSGSSFEYMAKKYSEDKNSSFKGGRLNPFSSGQINSIPFENAAFSLSENNNISDPIETKYGWHLIKFYSRKKIKSYEEMKFEILNKLKKSSRNEIISDSFYDFLMKKYNLSYENDNLKTLASIIDSTYFQGKWSIPEKFAETKPFLTINGNEYNFLDFATYLEDTQKITKPYKIDNLLKDKYKLFINLNIIEIYKRNLEKENKDYSFIVKEYREGLLLFNLMQQKIWKMSDSDSENLKIFFDENKSNYSSFEGEKGKVIGDYQKLKEENWLHQLRAKHTIYINKRAVRKLSKNYN
tara:strand:+ start:3152 stop:4786 length:1635 start_codon:yes stop_codon:yes gene_type:complete